MQGREWCQKPADRGGARKQKQARGGWIRRGGAVLPTTCCSSLKPMKEVPEERNSSPAHRGVIVRSSCLVGGRDVAGNSMSPAMPHCALCGRRYGEHVLLTGRTQPLMVHTFRCAYLGRM